MLSIHFATLSKKRTIKHRLNFEISVNVQVCARSVDKINWYIEVESFYQIVYTKFCDIYSVKNDDAMAMKEFSPFYEHDRVIRFVMSP